MSKILIVDDSNTGRLSIRSTLNKSGYDDVEFAVSAEDAFTVLKLGEAGQSASPYDLILMDKVMPGLNGIEAMKKIKADERLKDIPIIMITGEAESLETAFEAGAMDFVSKSTNKIEMLARVRSAISLKQEMDRRKELLIKFEEANVQLEQLNNQLKLLTIRDALTGLSNRRHFDEFLLNEWKRMARIKNHLSLIMIDIDFFKRYNDTYGHQGGDDCLKIVATAIKRCAKRPGDLVARYGGEEFSVILSETNSEGAVIVAETMRKAVQDRRIPNEKSDAAKHVTLSLGIATIIPETENSEKSLIKLADKALYEAKLAGRNRVVVCKV